ncbi:1-phosphofructokinase [Marinobacter maroccanus]|uniref:Phosphofructokinase n=1 Tax=Marinobacter maroccanus TaxID=2055143 RepID=A0A2S5ZCZ0_9GAMM|nr:1-phosphofructokinase [Marinobacter maroccanus]PPI85256.1 1-phosphofructokinase [Marinobacter maroccanus]
MARILTITLNPALDLSVETPTLAVGEVNRTGNTRLEPAGKGINVARVLARLGHSVTVTGLMGEGNASSFERLFAAEGLQDSFVRVPGQNRINIKIAEAGGRVTDLNGPGFRIPEDALQRLEFRLAPLLPECDGVVIGGSLPEGFPPSGLAALVQQASRAGKPVWLDTSGEGLKAGIEAAPFAVKPNMDELSGLAGLPLTDMTAVEAAVARVHAGGVSHVVVSMGADGVLWSSPAGILRSRVPPVSLVSTVCAGDTLLAGMLHGVLGGQPDEAALTFATALSAECVQHIGVGNPEAPDFSSLLQRTRVQPWPGQNNTGEMPL